MIKRWFCIAGFMILIAVCAGCGITRHESSSVKNQEDMEPVITVFDKSSGNSRFDDKIALEIQKRTGVRIELINPTEAPSQKARLMLANRDYPDIVITDLAAGNTAGIMADKYAEAGALIPLEVHIETMGPDIMTMYGDTLEDLRHEDGHIYYLTSWYGENLEPVAGFQIRYDILKELAGQERADSSEAFTQKEITELLRSYHQRYPEIDGQASIPFTFNQENSGRTLYGMFGLKYYHETDEGDIQTIYKAPEYLPMLLFLNQLYREELLDKDWLVNKAQSYEEKLKSGRVFMTAGAYWDMDSINVVLKEKYGGDAQFYSYKVLGDGIKDGETAYNGRNSLGWDCIGITDNCENVEAAMKVLNFLASEEGQYLTLWGIEGEDWDQVDGKRVPRKEILDSFEVDIEKTRDETGIRKWTWMTKNGNGSDGSPYDMATKLRLSESARRAYTNMSGDYWDTAPYAGIAPEAGTAEAAIQQEITAIGQNACYLAVCAKTPEESERIYADMLADMEKAGVDRLEQVMNERYRNKK